ncbi:cyclin-dependent protein kinase regulatory subunit suc1 [Phaffia rhodozyma]|uniref:Cyclin-dependent kinases regulatory subunit n=1 Tax=Phaffia rhodozyma TaxID=264483 RepID=A0A0F7SVG5_PHARH|nr:cyclin-dependent protein kinase regulatory subunit suc1 [Phaffia rhodozyma]
MKSHERQQRAIEKYADHITYSERYSDDQYEYRHVTLPKGLLKFIPDGILDEATWRSCGIRQSLGWEMYLRHQPEPHILLFKRDKDFDMNH